ncbi:MAG: saccharopine dehydrogenase C-terminal domain-containing protein [Candidatus Bathyarchaeia archaeon]
MKILVLGMGLMGPTVAKDCAEDPKVEKVTGCDIDEVKLKAAKKLVSNKKFDTKKVNITSHEELVKAMKGYDVAVNSTAAKFSMGVLKAAMEVGVNVVDLAGGGYPQDGEIYDEVRKAGITAMPGCGVDPGLIDLLCGQAMEHMDEVKSVDFACGGLPKDPKPPLDYKIVFGGTRMPIRPGKVPMIVDGKLKEVDRYSEVESIFVDGYKDMEAFVDGFPSSLLKLCQEKKVENFRGKTIRYEGFVEKLMFLLDLGVIGSKPVPYQGSEIVPLDLFHELIYPIIKFDEGAGDRDITVLLVRVSGKSGELDVDVTYDMVDEYDEENKVTSMAKTTGYTAAIIARILGGGAVKEKGIQWPVRIIRGAPFERLLSSLRERGVEITETITKTRGV